MQVPIKITWQEKQSHHLDQISEIQILNNKQITCQEKQSYNLGQKVKNNLNTEIDESYTVHKAMLYSVLHRNSQNSESKKRDWQQEFGSEQSWQQQEPCFWQQMFDCNGDFWFMINMAVVLRLKQQ